MSEPHQVRAPSDEPWCPGCNRPESRCVCNRLLSHDRTRPHEHECEDPVCEERRGEYEEGQ